MISVSLTFMGIWCGLLFGGPLTFRHFPVLRYCSGPDVRALQNSLGQWYSDVAYT